MKAVIRIPTVQFGYIEFHLDEKDLVKLDVVKQHNWLVAEYEKTKADVQKLKDDNF
jgi:hypothetical protein